MVKQMSSSGICSFLKALNGNDFLFGRILVELSKKKPKLWMRGSQTRISYSDQIPTENDSRQAWTFFFSPSSLRPSAALSFPGRSESWTVCFQMPLTVSCFLLSRMHTTEGSQTCNKGRIADLKIAAYTCRPTLSSSVAVGSSECTKCHIDGAASTKPMKEFWLSAFLHLQIIKS